MGRILFIGNFLSKHKGTKGVIERLAENKNDFEKVDFLLKSHIWNKVLRFIDILLTASFAKYESVIIDVYSGLYFKLVLYVSWIAKIRKKRMYFILHGGKLHILERQKPELFASVMVRGSGLITPSYFLIKELSKVGYTLSYLPNFLPIDKFPYAKRTHSSKILWVRAFASIYNPEMAISVLVKVRSKITDATLTMIGPDHGELAACIELIDLLKLGNAVTITGKIDNNELPHFYHTHGVFLNTTSYESFGLAVLEAASCGIPVVSNRVGEIPYIWKENEEMMLCNPGDDQEMADKVVRLLLNPDQAASLSLRARKKAEQFSWEAVKPQWKKLLQDHE